MTVAHARKVAAAVTACAALVGALALWAVVGRAASASTFRQESDIEGSKDYPLFPRLPGYYIQAYSAKDHDSVDVSPYLSGADADWVGAITTIDYTAQPGISVPSMTQIAAHYAEALKKLGAKTLYSDARVILARLERNGKVTYVNAAAFNEGRKYELVIVEKQSIGAPGGIVRAPSARPPGPAVRLPQPPSRNVRPLLPHGPLPTGPGKATYDRMCVSCHGKTGQGNAAKAKELKIDPAKLNLGRDETRGLTRHQLQEIVAKGKGKMPAYEKRLTAQQLADVTDYAIALAKWIRNE